MEDRDFWLSIRRALYMQIHCDEDPALTDKERRATHRRAALLIVREIEKRLDLAPTDPA